MEYTKGNKEVPGREAFCSICPPVQEVTTKLQALGFHLTFSMKPTIYPPSSATPRLPAQYHYADEHGTEIIFLAGRDYDLDGRRLPPHASHWWIYPGANGVAYQHVVQALAATWPLTWLSSPNSMLPCSA